MEIERKFMVNRVPENLQLYPHEEIEQGYLCTSPTLRIRKAGDVFWLTVKEKVYTNSTAIHNREEEFRLTEDKFLMLKGKCIGKMINKTRYRIPLQQNPISLTAELDIFHGIHEGLLLVEVEFPSSEVADSFTPPSWFGRDVSNQPQFRNSYLALQQ